MIIAIFSIINIPAVKEFFAEEPFTFAFAWPGLDVLNPAGDPVATTTFNFNWLPAAGTLMIFAGIITAVILKVSPGRRRCKTYGETYVELKSAIITVMAVLALAYVMNLSGQTASLGAWLAGAGAAFALLSPILGWLGVAVTGSDTSANALFGALQVQTAAQAGLDPVLMAAANTSGGVLGKMVSPQNLAIAAAAVGMAGREGDIFRKVIGWSLGLLVLHVRPRRPAVHAGARLDGALTVKARLRPSTAAGLVPAAGAAFLLVLGTTVALPAGAARRGTASTGGAASAASTGRRADRRRAGRPQAPKRWLHDRARPARGYLVTAGLQDSRMRITEVGRGLQARRPGHGRAARAAALVPRGSEVRVGVGAVCSVPGRYTKRHPMKLGVVPAARQRPGGHLRRCRRASTCRCSRTPATTSYASGPGTTSSTATPASTGSSGRPRQRLDPHRRRRRRHQGRRRRVTASSGSRTTTSCAAAPVATRSAAARVATASTAAGGGLALLRRGRDHAHATGATPAATASASTGRAVDLVQPDGSAEDLGLLGRELRLGQDALLLELAELLELGDDVDRRRGRQRAGARSASAPGRTRSAERRSRRPGRRTSRPGVVGRGR